MSTFTVRNQFRPTGSDALDPRDLEDAELGLVPGHGAVVLAKLVVEAPACDGHGGVVCLYDPRSGKLVAELPCEVCQAVGAVARTPWVYFPYEPPAGAAVVVEVGLTFIPMHGRSPLSDAVVRTALTRHAAGDWGAVGRFADAVPTAGEAFAPGLAPLPVRNRIAVETGRGVVRSRFGAPPWRSGGPPEPEALDIITIKIPGAGPQTYLAVGPGGAPCFGAKVGP